LNISKASLLLALAVLEPFRDNSAYEDYQAEDGWTNKEYEQMIAELRHATQETEITDTDFVYRELEEYAIPHLNPRVAELCSAIGETILVKLRFDADIWGRGEHWVRVEADIYGLEREELLEKFGFRAATAYDAYQSSGCDNELRYDGDYNWTSLGSDMEKADEILQAYVAEQQKRYPGCVIQID
jgi:hypothetical protein